MCDENIMELSALYIDDIFKCYKSIRDIAETFPLQPRVSWFCNIVYRLDI